MGYVNAKLPPEIQERLEKEVEEGKWDHASEGVRYYLAVGMEQEGQLREQVEELKKDKEMWQEQAQKLSDMLD